MTARPAAALGPHEVALIVNGASSDSVRVAGTFARLRGVPGPNVVTIDLPPGLSSAAAAVSPEEFRSRIHGPVRAALRERGLGHVLAWVYSVDLPLTVSTAPPVSLTGMTWLDGRVPRTDEIDRAVYRSPVYAGPDGRNDAAHFPQSFDTVREWLGSDMPLPAMVLGVTGPRGNSVETIERSLAAARAADGTAPSGTVYFVENDDIRSNCREWQFRGAVAELAAAGVRAEVTQAMPPRGAPVAGLMMGLAVVDPQVSGPYLGGAMAEHLTSAGGIFGSASQTKLTAWIGAGAAASCGTVSEPYAAWPKFPHARFFVHYAAGCTMLESFAQAVRSPLQLLLVGDPLASPWGQGGGGTTLTLRGVGERVTARKVRLEAVVQGAGAPAYRRMRHFLDGRLAGEGAVCWIDLSRVPPGPHTLRTVAYGTGLVRRQVFGETTFTVTE